MGIEIVTHSSLKHTSLDGRSSQICGGLQQAILA